MIQEISPGFKLDGGVPINQVKQGIESLINEQTGSPSHQLALIIGIRKVFADD